MKTKKPAYLYPYNFLSIKHLMDIRCFGPKCLDELIDTLRLYNLDVQKYIDLKEALRNGNC